MPIKKATEAQEQIAVIDWIKATEAQEQIAVIDWIRLQHNWLLAHTIYIMNERKSSIHVGALHNRMGRLRGASDLFLAWPTSDYYGLFIELKSLSGKPTIEQKAFIKRMSLVGYYSCICYGAEEAIEVIKAYLANKL